MLPDDEYISYTHMQERRKWEDEDAIQNCPRWQLAEGWTLTRLFLISSEQKFQAQRAGSMSVYGMLLRHILMCPETLNRL